MNSVQFCAVRKIFEVAPKKTIVGIHVRWTWWPWRPIHEALWKSIQQGAATRHHLGRTYI